jgi:phospholipid/cholesterol/gamma-HCH transport system permease protein
LTHDGLHIERDDNRIRIHGAVDLQHFSQVEKELKKLSSKKETIINLMDVTHLDTAGALLLQNTGMKLEHLRPEHKALLDLVTHAEPGKPPMHKPISSFRRMVVRFGKATIHAWHATIEFITFTGRACVALAKALRHPSRLRFVSIMHHIEAIGIDATPIIVLIASVISIVIAYQGQVQLKPLGAEQYTVNLIVISVLREMGVLLTSIMIAGRSGSAFTAEIGTMQVREEIDALKSIGFDPFELLVLPRLIALIIALPLLTFIADGAGLFGGAMISLPLLDISMPQYLEQARHAATWKDFFVGMFKAPIFAFVIALVGCMHGLKVSGSSESVGKETTASVVEAIFLVLLLDGLFSVYFQKVGL